MWIARWFVIILFLIILGFFISSNINTKVEKLHLIIATPENVSVTSIIFLSFLLGFLTWFFISLFNIFKLKLEVATKDKVIKSLKEELNAQRNKGLIDDEDDDEDSGMKTMIINKKDLKG